MSSLVLLKSEDGAASRLCLRSVSTRNDVSEVEDAPYSVSSVGWGDTVLDRGWTRRTEGG